MILSVSMLLGWLAERRSNGALARAAKAIDAVVDATLENPSRRTADLGGTAGCKAFGELVARAL
jgi:3-isopropylmalate dehydrogenase